MRDKQGVRNNLEGDEAPEHITFTRCADWNRKLETLMDSVSARRMLNEISDNVPSHQVVLIDEETTFFDPDEPVRHLNTMIRTGLGSAEFDVWPFPNRILDMQRSKMLAWPDAMQVEIKIHLRKRPCVDAMQRKH